MKRRGGRAGEKVIDVRHLWRTEKIQAQQAKS